MDSGDGRNDGLIVFLFDVGIKVGGSGDRELGCVSLPDGVVGRCAEVGEFVDGIRVKSCTLHCSFVKHVSPSGHSIPVGQCDSIEHFTVSHVRPQKRMLPGLESSRKIFVLLAMRRALIVKGIPTRNNLHR